MYTKMSKKKFLLWFAHEHTDFRRSETESILDMFNIDVHYLECSDDEPFWILECDSEEDIARIASRSVSLRWCLELWGRAKDSESLHKVMRRSLVDDSDNWYHAEEFDNGYSCPLKMMRPYFTAGKTFKFTVETFCRHFSNAEKIQKIEEFNYIPMEGSVRLKNPDTELMLIEYYGTEANNIPLKPYDIFVGRLIAEGQRHLICKLSLKSRKFIGNTSMDPQLSLLMVNQARVNKGDLVIDPFVGSGSLLVAAAMFGGYVWGSDIDFLMLHGRSKPSRVRQKVRESDESIKGNMKQYSTHDKYLDVIISDFSMPLWRNSLMFDAIITDPPYGIREPTEKIGIEKDNYTLAPEHMLNHIPSKVDYSLSNIYSDLLAFAVKHLRITKRLVCWYPYYRDDYSEDKLPAHPNLKLVGNSEQILSRFTARRLLTYEKFRETCGESPSAMTGHHGEESHFRRKYFSPEEGKRCDK